nr:immunoglobulin light chain junction region [Macaca mulatta]
WDYCLIWHNNVWV